MHIFFISCSRSRSIGINLLFSNSHQLYEDFCLLNSAASSRWTLSDQAQRETSSSDSRSVPGDTLGHAASSDRRGEVLAGMRFKKKSLNTCKTAKKPLWRHQNIIFKIWEKCHLKFFLRLSGPSFNKIGPKLLKLETTTDRHTHTHTDAQTGIVLGQHIQSWNDWI